MCISCYFLYYCRLYFILFSVIEDYVDNQLLQHFCHKKLRENECNINVICFALNESFNSLPIDPYQSRYVKSRQQYSYYYSYVFCAKQRIIIEVNVFNCSKIVIWSLFFYFSNFCIMRFNIALYA